LFKFPIELDMQEHVLEFRTHSRRSVVIGTASALAAAALPQLISAQSATPAGGASPAAADGRFPVSITHVFGETTIEMQPVRGVTWGWESQDAVITLSIIPVAIPSNEWGGDSDMILPWTRRWRYLPFKRFQR
jgi:iron complex transport system substrate-binding protein